MNNFFIIFMFTFNKILKIKGEKLKMVDQNY